MKWLAGPGFPGGFSGKKFIEMERDHKVAACELMNELLNARSFEQCEGDMQILIQVISTSKESLRQAIANDDKLEKYAFKVSEHKRLHRDNGWAKIHSTLPDRRGAININWDSKSGILFCRVLTRGGAMPNLIIGDFIDYLLARYRSKIQAINILPR